MARQPEDDEDLETAAATTHSSSPLVLYIVTGVAAFIAVGALGTAIFALNSNRAMQEQLDTNKSNIRKIANVLNEARVEVKRLNIALAQEKAATRQARAKHEELMTKVVQNLSPLQTRLKIHPTLEEQLRQAEAAASAPAATSTLAPTRPAEAKPAAPHNAEPKHSPEVNSMLKAIKEFNKQ